MPILGVIASQKSGRLAPNFVSWASNVVSSGSGNINIVATGNAKISGTNAYLQSGGAGAGISGGNYPAYWTQDVNGTYIAARKFVSLTGWYNSTTFTDSSGNVYMSVGSGSGDAVVTKINSSGSVVWAKNINGYKYTNIYGLTPDEQKLIIGGIGNYEEDRLACMNVSDGAIQWARVANSYSVQNSYTGGVTASYAWACGYERGGSNMGFIRQCNISNGNMNWSKWYNNGDYSVTTASFADSSNNIYVGGYQSSRAYFIKVDSSGNLVWAKQFGSGQEFPKWGDVDSAGNVYVQHNNGSKSFLIKLNSSGTVQWQRELTGSASTSNSGTVQVLSNDYIFVTFSASDGSYVNGYQMVLPTDGSKTGTYTVGGKTLNYTASSLSIGNLGGSMSASQSYSAYTQNITDGGLGTIQSLGNTTGLTNL